MKRRDFLKAAGLTGAATAASAVAMPAIAQSSARLANQPCLIGGNCSRRQRDRPEGAALPLLLLLLSVLDVLALALERVGIAANQSSPGQRVKGKKKIRRLLCDPQSGTVEILSVLVGCL